MTTEEFTELVEKNQPHEVFKIDWNYYSPVDFADTFLPQVGVYNIEGLKFYDGAELLTQIKSSSNTLLKLADDSKSLSLITSTFPLGVEAGVKKFRVQPANYEIAVFIEIDQSENATISFKFGNNFKDFISNQKLSPRVIEEKKFKTDIESIQNHFKQNLSQKNMVEFVLKTTGIAISSAYGNSDKGKLEALLKENKIQSFFYINKCSKTEKVIIYGSITGGSLLLEKINESQLEPVVRSILLQEDSGVFFKKSDQSIVRSDLAIPKKYNDGICPDFKASLTDSEISHISEIVTEHINFTKLEGVEKQYAALNNEIEKQLSNPFYDSINLCVNLSITGSSNAEVKKIAPLDGSNQVAIQDNIKTFTSKFQKKEGLCEVLLNIVIDGNGKLSIKHEVSKDYLKEFEDKWEKEIKKRGLEKEIDITELREQVLKDFVSSEVEHNFYERFIQKTKAILSKQVGGYIEAIQATQKIAKNVWDEGQVNESTWHSNKDGLTVEHQLWPAYVQFEPVIGGATDGVIDEIVGIPMAIKGVYGIATDEKQREAIGKLFTKEGLSNVLDGLKDEVEEIKTDEQKAGHFGAKTTVTVVTMFFGVGFITKTGKLGDAVTTVTNKAVKVVSAKVMKTIKELKDWFKYKPEGRKVIDDFKNEVGEDIFVESIEEVAEDIDKLNEIKFQPQKFVDGKRLERNIERLIDSGDQEYLSKIANKAGISPDDLKDYVPLKQVQINLPDGGFTVADNVWVKSVDDGLGGTRYDVIINEVKLSKDTPFTARQKEFLDDIGKPDIKFTTRSKKPEIDREIPQNSKINIQSYIRTSGDGTSNNLSNLEIERLK